MYSQITIFPTPFPPLLTFHLQTLSFFSPTLVPSPPSSLTHPRTQRRETPRVIFSNKPTDKNTYQTWLSLALGGITWVLLWPWWYSDPSSVLWCSGDNLQHPINLIFGRWNWSMGWMEVSDRSGEVVLSYPSRLLPSRRRIGFPFATLSRECDPGLAVYPRVVLLIF